jgi:hypothetical protein
MEKRKKNAGKSSPIPADYAEMVTEVFTATFDEGLKGLKKLKVTPAHFEVHGAVYPDEVVLAVSLHVGEGLAATTVYGSSDFDPRASSPQIQDLLGAAVDAIGGVFTPLLSGGKESLEAVASESLSALEKVPFEWTPVVVEKVKIHVKIDKANPKLDQMADDWLSRNDPDFKERQARERAETEKLFVTGDTAKAKASGNRGGGKVH